jgi:hypothetical protein
LIFSGSDLGGQHAAVVYTLIQIAKLNDIDSQAWLVMFSPAVPAIPSRLGELPPWNSQSETSAIAAGFPRCSPDRYKSAHLGNGAVSKLHKAGAAGTAFARKIFLQPVPSYRHDARAAMIYR